MQLIIQELMLIRSLSIKMSFIVRSLNVFWDNQIVKQIIQVEFMLIKTLHLEFLLIQISQMVGSIHFAWYVKIKMRQRVFTLKLINWAVIQLETVN